MIRPALVALIAVTRHRTAVRHRQTHPQLGFAVAMGATIGVLFIVGSLPIPYYASFWPEPGAYWYGTRVATRPAMVRAVVREVAAVGILILVALAALTAVSADDWEHQPVELLTAVSVQTAAIGVLLDKLFENGWFVGPTALAGSIAFAAGSGTPRAAVGALVGSLVLLSTGLVAGTALGLALRVGLRVSSHLYRLRYGLGSIALFALFLTLVASRTVSGALAATPLGLYGDLVLVTTPGAGIDPRRALAALTITAVVVPGAVAAAVTTTRRLWFDDSVQRQSSTSKRHSSDTGRVAVDTLLETILSRPTTVVVDTVWYRMRRSPRALLYVFFPLAIAGPATLDVVQRAPTLVPVLVALYGAGAVGMGTTLNPLGNERVALATIRTTPAGPQSVLRGHAVAACLPGIPLVLALTMPIALFLTRLSTAIALGFVAVVLTVSGAGISLGVGALLPNLEGPQAGTLTPPQLHAILLYLLVLSVVALPAVAGIGLTPSPSLLVLSLTVLATTVLGTIVGWAGYRYALSVVAKSEVS